MLNTLPARAKAIIPASIKNRVKRQLLKQTGSVGKYRYVFIVTYGRSGSTLLMSILNTIPGYRIHGENNNALYRVYQVDKAITTAYHLCAGKPRHRRPQSPWYGMPRARPDNLRFDLINSFVNNVLRPAAGDRVLGFKEIRYTKSDIPDLSDYLEFLKDAFPGCKVLFNHRSLSNVSKSSWWALDAQAREKLEAADARMLAIPASTSYFHFFYDEIDEELGNIRRLFDFLGEEVDEDSIRKVLATRHSPPPAKYAKKTQ